VAEDVLAGKERCMAGRGFTGSRKGPLEKDSFISQCIESRRVNEAAIRLDRIRTQRAKSAP